MVIQRFTCRCTKDIHGEASDRGTHTKREGYIYKALQKPCIVLWTRDDVVDQFHYRQRKEDFRAPRR